MAVAPPVPTPELPALTAEGYLRDAAAWTEAHARELARRDGVALGDEHFAVLHYLREYHAACGEAPGMRLLLRGLAQRLGPAHASSRRLYQLFPQGPAKQACRYAGLPKPASCI